MTEQIFIRQYHQVPQSLKQELWDYFQYLLFKNQIGAQVAGPKTVPDQKPADENLNGSVVLAEDFEARLWSIPENLDEAALIREQNLTGFDRVNFDKMVDKMNVQEPVEELLDALTP